jgi:serine/threonine protein phosphatase PrpC
VLASDGVWDVVSTEDVLKWGLKKKYRIPSDFADYLAKKAKKLRMIQELREDDITVVVVDINSAFLDVLPDEDDGRVAFKSKCCQS